MVEKEEAPSGDDGKTKRSVVEYVGAFKSEADFGKSNGHTIGIIHLLYFIIHS